jgi:hypothetical protein
MLTSTSYTQKKSLNFQVFHNGNKIGKEEVDLLYKENFMHPFKATIGSEKYEAHNGSEIVTSVFH